jgi:hypothetical protein
MDAGKIDKSLGLEKKFLCVDSTTFGKMDIDGDH